MDFIFRWDKDSEAWIDALPQRFNGALKTGLVRAIKSGIVRGLRRSRSLIPRFESTAMHALGKVDPIVGEATITAYIGFKNDTIFIPADDSPRYGADFNYAWAKEKSEPAETHTVMLYNPKSKKSTPGRAKLVRWLKKNVGGDYLNLPDAPDATAWNAKRKDNPLPAPWVEVHPGESATAYLTGLIEDDGDPLASWIFEDAGLHKAIKDAWEA